MEQRWQCCSSHRHARRSAAVLCRCFLLHKLTGIFICPAGIIKVKRTSSSSNSSAVAGLFSSGKFLSAAQAPLARQLQATFLPSGFPKTVATGYLPYVWWQAVHHCASAVNGGLSAKD